MLSLFHIRRRKVTYVTPFYSYINVNFSHSFYSYRLHRTKHQLKDKGKP